MKSTRRTFLRRTGLGLAALGLYESGLGGLVDRYGQVLAAPTTRKLALLVGINRYAESVCDFSVKGTALNGCLTDVELQRQLLMHRFGFQPADIVTLTDQQATREAIETTFLQHLIAQARSGDVVVFHFSGLGSRVALTTGGNPDGAATTVLSNSLVPVDGTLPTPEDATLRDLPEQTLALLLRSLPTQQAIALLDVGYTETGAILQGNLRVRSRPSAPTGQLLADEQQLQEFLLQLSRQGGLFQSSESPPSSLLLRAAPPQQVVMEGQWGNFSAGLLTYTLTQSLWNSTEPRTLWIALRNTQAALGQLVGTVQQPDLSGPLAAVPILEGGVGAEGVVTAVDAESRNLSLWLAGLPAIVLDNCAMGTLLAVTPPPGGGDRSSDPSAFPLLQLRSREGLSARASLLATDPNTVLPEVGQRVWEQVRLLPRGVGLTVALDNSLERIERVDATSAFAAARVAVVTAGEQCADYVFGKVVSPVLSAALPPDNRGAEETPAPAEMPALPRTTYGLFSPGRGAVPGITLPGEKAVKTTVAKLTPQVRSLLAIKLLRLTQNPASSQLGVQATLLGTSPQEQVFWQQTTARAPGSAPPQATPETVGIPQIPAGSPLQYRLTNYGDRPLYVLLVGWDHGRAIVRNGPDVGAIAAGETLTLPFNAGTPAGATPDASGLTEMFLLFSRTPFTQALTLLNNQSTSPVLQSFALLTDPLALVQCLLHDLNEGSRIAMGMDLPADTYALDVRQWATLPCLYEVTAIAA